VIADHEGRGKEGDVNRLRHRPTTPGRADGKYPPALLDVTREGRGTSPVPSFLMPTWADPPIPSREHWPVPPALRLTASRRGGAIEMNEGEKPDSEGQGVTRPPIVPRRGLLRAKAGQQRGARDEGRLDRTGSRTKPALLKPAGKTARVDMGWSRRCRRRLAGPQGGQDGAGRVASMIVPIAGPERGSRSMCGRGQITGRAGRRAFRRRRWPGRWP